MIYYNRIALLYQHQTFLQNIYYIYITHLLFPASLHPMEPHTSDSGLLVPENINQPVVIVPTPV
jgi:hypothetical protein